MNRRRIVSESPQQARKGLARLAYIAELMASVEDEAMVAWREERRKNLFRGAATCSPELWRKITGETVDP